MYPVSEDFQTKIRAKARQVFAKCEISYTDPFMDQSITINVNESARVSYPAQTVDGILEPTGKYASLDGSWALGSKYVLAPTPEEARIVQMGWWGEQLAEIGGVFSGPTNPILTVEFFARPIDSLRVVGDSLRGEYPVDFEIVLYNEAGHMLHTETVIENNLVAWFEMLDQPIPEVVKMTLEISRWSHEGRQVKILEFLTSLQETYYESDIVSISLLEEREVTGVALPVGSISSNELSLSLYNREGKFDADNDASLLRECLKPNRRIKVWMGVKSTRSEREMAIECTSMDEERYLMVGNSRGQSFKAVGPLDGATKVAVSILGTSRFFMPPDTIQFDIYRDNDGAPGESISSMGFHVMLGLDWPEGESKWVEVEIRLDEPLQMDVRYWIILAASPEGHDTGYIKHGVSTTGGFPDGYVVEKGKYDSSWTLQQDMDMTFKIEVISADTADYIEYVPLGTFWSLDWEAPDDLLIATVTARDRMELLRRTTYEGEGVVENKSLAYLAERVLQDAGLYSEEYHIDPSLGTIKVPYAWFEPVSHREALRIIAEAGMATAYADREGIIQIVPLVLPSQVSGQDTFFLQSTMTAEVDYAEGFGITPADYYRKDSPQRYGDIANEVVVETQPLQISDTKQEVYKSSEDIVVQASQIATITVYYNEVPVVEAAADLVGAITTEISDETYFSWGARIELLNTGGIDESIRVVIEGKPLKVTNKERIISQNSGSIADLGVLRHEVSNPLVQTREIAQQLADAIVTTTSDPGRDVEMEWRGNPALELGDAILVLTSMKRDRRSVYTVIKQELYWDGALQATLTGRKG